MEFVDRSSIVTDVRGIGCVQGIEIYENNRPSKDLAEKLEWALFDRGLLVVAVGRYHNVIKLTPPITITASQMEESIGILESSLRAISP
jgi:4-aminobutyrate aminotransferase-like enzyme